MNGFFKVAQDGGSYIVATFYNPATNETKSMCVRDYDYADGSRDNDALYYMPIDDAARIKWLHSRGIVLVGDTVKVVKGRKIPIGHIGRVAQMFDYKDRFGRIQSRYVVFDDGQKTNINNCILHHTM